MKRFFVLTVFNHETYFYCFDTLDLLFKFIKYQCDTENQFYIESKWLSYEMMKKLNIDYIKV